jgi:CRP-like cAMP-binding protein
MDAPLRASVTDDNGEMLMPAELRARSRGEKCRKQLWYLTFTTSYANCLIYLLNYRVDDDHLPEWWAENRDGLMLANYILLALGLMVCGGLTMYYLRRPPIEGEDTQGERLWHGFRVPKWSRINGYLWSCTVHIVVQTLPYYLWIYYQEHNATPAHLARITAAVFTLLTVVSGIREVIKHVNNYYQPRIQKHIIRILLMPVVYAIDCLVSLVWMDYDPYVHLIREQYEAYTVWSFQALMIEFLTNVATLRQQQGLLREEDDIDEPEDEPEVRFSIRNSLFGGKSEDGTPRASAAPASSFFTSLPQFQEEAERYKQQEHLLIRLLKQEDHDPHHMFPLNIMGVRNWKKGEEFLSKCRSGVLQYVAYSSSMSFVNLVLELTGNFHEGDLSLSYGYVYVITVRSLSQTWALYCLVLFYHATAELLEPIKPFPKFVAIKLVVFATFWQAIVIDVMEEMHWIDLDTWRFAEGACVPGIGEGDGGERRMLMRMLEESEGFVIGEGEGLWNSTERGCVEHGWLWSHPTEDVCFDGRDDECHEGAVCHDHICFENVDEEGYLEDVSKGLQNVLVCIEMFVAAMAHSWCFTYKAHRPINYKDDEDGPAKLSKAEALREMANWNDVSEMGLGKMIKDTRAFGRGVAQGMKDPATLEFYWPNAQQLSSPDLAALLSELEGERERREHKAILRKVPILGQLSDAEMDGVVAACEPLTFDYKTKIISEGDEGHDMYVLIKGGAAAFKVGVNSGGAIMRYTRGQFFGEKALLNSEPRAATISAERGGATCLRLSREAYKVVLENAAVADSLTELNEHYQVSEAQLEARRLQTLAKVEAARALADEADAADAGETEASHKPRGVSFGDARTDSDEEPSGPPPPASRGVQFGMQLDLEPEPEPQAEPTAKAGGVTFGEGEITAL